MSRSHCRTALNSPVSACLSMSSVSVHIRQRACNYTRQCLPVWACHPWACISDNAHVTTLASVCLFEHVICERAYQTARLQLHSPVSACLSMSPVSVHIRQRACNYTHQCVPLCACHLWISLPDIVNVAKLQFAAFSLTSTSRGALLCACHATHRTCNCTEPNSPVAAAPRAARTTAHTGEAAPDVHITRMARFFCLPSRTKHSSATNYG
jgi:hypothetical protein